MSLKKGRLILIPNLLGGTDINIINKQAAELTLKIKYFFVEEIKNARRFLSLLGANKNNLRIDDLTFFEFNKHIENPDYSNLIHIILDGNDMGILSDAGCPAIADPGGTLVQLAHNQNIEIIPLIGASSIILSLMASGLNGQSFAFNGYLPIKLTEKLTKIKQLEHKVFTENQTQIFIETPYRNQDLLTDIIQKCNPNTCLCVACDLTLPSQLIISKPIHQWRKITVLPNLNKRPCVFLLGNK